MSKTDTGINKFIYIQEIVYAILLSWGFARVAEFFKWSDIIYWLCTLVSLFTLIRFFFAPSHNFAVVAKLVNNRTGAARIVIFWDISILVIHSFIYYRMCYALSQKHYPLFYFEFAILLLLNSVWLGTITFRQKRAKENPHDKHIFWQRNNLIYGVLLLLLLLFNANVIWMFLAAFVNCARDFWVCAMDYFKMI